MGQQHRIIRAAVQIQHILDHAVAPRAEGHLQQKHLRTLQTKQIHLTHPADAFKILHLGAQADRRHIVRQHLRELFPRARAAAQELFGGILIGIEVRRSSQNINSLRIAFPQHGCALGAAAAAVIHLGQHMRVKVDHFCAAFFSP